MIGATMNEPDNAIDITVVVTCYNEERFITDTLESVTSALREVGCSYEILVIDDVSTDRSRLRVEQYIREHPDEPVRLHLNLRNRGLANNYVEAAFLGRGKYYRLCCGDNSEPKEVLVRIFRQIGAADIIIPYQEQKEIVGKSRGRKIVSSLFTAVVNLISGNNIKYYNGSAVHLRYNVMRWHPSTYGFGFQADIITRLLSEGATYIQVPSVGIDRKGGKSTAANIRNILSVMHTLLELTIRRIRQVLYQEEVFKGVETSHHDGPRPRIVTQSTMDMPRRPSQ